MATKVGKRLNASNDEGDNRDLLNALDTSQYICVIWDPPKSHPVNAYYVKMNDIPLAPSNPNDPDSPAVFRIPAALRGQNVTVSWYVAPTLQVRSIGVAHSSLGAGAPTLIKQTTIDANCKPPGDWQDDDVPVQL